MLPTSDTPQDRRPTQTEIFQANGQEKKKKAWVAILTSDKIDFKRRAKKRDPYGHFTICRGRSHQEDINIVNIYAPNIGAPEYMKKILEDFRKDMDRNTIIVGDFNNPLSKMERSSKQNIKKDMVALNNALHEMGLTDYIYRLSSPKSKIHILFKCTWNIFKDRTQDRI